MSLSGLLVHNGTVQLFSDSTCTTAASNAVTVTSGTASLTANALTAGNHQFYVQHTDSSSNTGDCFGPADYAMETLVLALSSPTASPALDSTPTFGVTGLVIQSGTVRLFSDSTCTTAAGGEVNVSSGTASITANSLTGASHQFYVQHKDSNNNVGDCVGPVAYSMEIPAATVTSSMGLDATPTFGVTGLLVHNGNIQLFSDSGCTTSASAAVNVSSGTASIAADSLSKERNQLYIQHTDSANNKGDCFEFSSYRYYGHKEMVSSGGEHTCALTSSGGVKCWGNGDSGELGNDGTDDKDHPVDVVDGDGSSTALTGIVQISAGNYHNCALTSSGGVKCWGNGDSGELGNDGTDDKDHPVDVVDGDGSTTALTGIVQVSAGPSHTCALTSSGGVKCWGTNGGRLGNDDTANKDHPVDVVDGEDSTTPLTGIVQISAGNYHNCALTSSGGVKCWGDGYSGQLGNGGWYAKGYPVDVVDGEDSTTPLTGIVQISAGNYHNCALTSSGGVKCWRDGWNGQLGNNFLGLSGNDELFNNHPVDVVNGASGTTALTGIVQVSAGAYRTCALTSSGGGKCWGEGANGELGDGGSYDRSHPVDVVIPIPKNNFL